MKTVITCFLAVLIAIVTSSFGYGWFSHGGFYLPGAALNLFLVCMEIFIVRSALDK